jgi:hypothetical protein
MVIINNIFTLNIYIKYIILFTNILLVNLSCLSVLFKKLFYYIFYTIAYKCYLILKLVFIIKLLMNKG